MISFFDKDTGKFIFYARGPSKKADRFKAAGHIEVQGKYNRTFKYENGAVVPDIEVLDEPVQKAGKLKRANQVKKWAKDAPDTLTVNGVIDNQRLEEFYAQGIKLMKAL